MPIWFFGMPRRPTKRASQSNAHPARRHNRRLFKVARAVVRDDAEAEDIVQEIVCAGIHPSGYFSR